MRMMKPFLKHFLFFFQTIISNFISKACLLQKPGNHQRIKKILSFPITSILVLAQQYFKFCVVGI